MHNQGLGRGGFHNTVNCAFMFACWWQSIVGFAHLCCLVLTKVTVFQPVQVQMVTGRFLLILGEVTGQHAATGARYSNVGGWKTNCVRSAELLQADRGHGKHFTACHGPKCHLFKKKEKKKKLKEWLRDGGRVSNVFIISTIWRIVPVHPPFSVRSHTNTHAPPCTPYPFPSLLPRTI